MLSLDYHVEVALNEAQWHIDAEYACEEDIERPSTDQVAWSMTQIQKNFDDDTLGQDLQYIHAFLDQRSDQRILT